MPTVNEILEKYNDAKRDSLIPLLQEVQELEGFLSESAIVEVSKKLNLSSSKIYGVATFYNQFRFDKPGQYQIQICRGTACHVKGSATVLKALEAELAVEAGQTTRDGLFSLEVVACIGACGLAPVISINGEFFAGVKPEDINGILETYRKKATEDDK
jgi:NADH-quinone oxidoreductase subunit E